MNASISKVKFRPIIPTGLLGEVADLNDNSKLVLFCTKCVPSQRVTMRQYGMWAIVCKDSVDVETVGDEMINAYSSCTAGLLLSCDYVAGLLFRIEAADLLGHMHQTSIRQLSQWNIPSHIKQVEPTR